MILITGLPNAGKTTFSKKFNSVTHYDDYKGRTNAECYKLCNRAAARSEDDLLVVEGVYYSADQRKELLRHVQDRLVKICIWLDTPPEECLKRENRGRPHLMIETHVQKFEPPTLDEGWDLIIIVRNDGTEVIS